MIPQKQNTTRCIRTRIKYLYASRLRKENFELQEELKQRSKVAEQKLFAMKMDFEQRLKKRNDLWQRRLDRKEKSLHEVGNVRSHEMQLIHIFFVFYIDYQL